MKNDLSNSLIETIVDETGNILSDASKTAINVLADNDMVFQGIPFVSVVISTYKIGKSVLELHHVKQLSRFAEEIRNETIDVKKREKYIRKFRAKSNKERDKELEYIVLISAKYISEEKPQYLAKLYLAYIEGMITWDSFVSYTEILDRFLPGDVETLEGGNQKDVKDEEVSDSLLRLVSLGLFYSAVGDVSVNNYPGKISIPGDIPKNYCLTSFGRKMRECLGFTDMGYLIKTIESLSSDRR